MIGAESFSRLLDWEDRGTCVLFGDGAGAIVLGRQEISSADDAKPQRRGILSTHLHSDGAYRDILFVDGGPGSSGLVGKVHMQGKEVFRHATEKMAAVVEEALAANNLTSEQIDWLIPHQANRRIIDATARKLGFSPDKVIVTVDKHANTSAASIPLALSVGVADGRVQPGQLILLEALGGGLTWGSALIRLVIIDLYS